MREGAGELEGELESIRGELLTVRPPEPVASAPIEDYDEIDEEEDEDDDEAAARGSWPSAAERASAPSAAKSETKQESLPSEPEIAEPEPARRVGRRALPEPGPRALASWRSTWR